MSKEEIDVCILDLLNIRRSVKNTCFSDAQIDMLFQLWREFMFDKFRYSESVDQAIKDVETLYSNATSVESKYMALRLDRATSFGESRLPALHLNETEWVMKDTAPTPFIEFLRKRPEIMERLRMSFKPYVMHSGVLEKQDFMNLLVRYVFWLKDDRNRSLNVIGVDARKDAMLEVLKTEWSNARFHVAILKNDNDDEKYQRWVCVLIDTYNKSFEYYDPLGRPLDISGGKSVVAETIGEIYLTALNLQPDIVTKSMHTINRGFHKHQTSGSECGMYVILFLHSRVATGKTFEEFADTGISAQDCRQIKSHFFVLPGATIEKPVPVSSTKFAEYDMRLAALEFVRYLAHVESILTNTEQRAIIAKHQRRLMELIVTPTDYPAIRVEGIAIQRDILAMLPTFYTEYAGTDMWFAMIQEVVSDPLTIHLRQISQSESKQKRSKSTDRKQLAQRIFSEVIGWTMQMGAPKSKVDEANMFMRQSLDSYYIPILRFDADNRRKFDVGMQPLDFVRESMSRQDSVSFGVHFMREVRNFVVNTLQIGIVSDLTTKYAVKSVIVQPVSPSNVEEIRQKINQCDQVIRQAYDLLKSVFAEQITTKPQPPSLALPVFRTQPSSSLKTDQIVQQIRAGMENQTFLMSGIEPWNFPMNTAKYQEEALPNEFNIYSLTDEDMKGLLNNEMFRLYYTMELMVVSHFIAQKQFGSDVASMKRNTSIVLQSVLQFLVLTEPFTEHRRIMCTILNRLYNAIKSVGIPELDNLVHLAGRYNQLCVQSKDIDETNAFFQRVSNTYKTIVGRN